MLMTEKNTSKVERAVRRSARQHFDRAFVDAVFEHGQWWVMVDGGTFSVIDAGCKIVVDKPKALWDTLCMMSCKSNREGNQMISADDEMVQDFLRIWHESGREEFERLYKNLNYDDCYPKSAKERRKYIALDSGTSGVYLVDRESGYIYNIKAYGVPNRRVSNSLADLANCWQFRASALTANGRR